MGALVYIGPKLAGEVPREMRCQGRVHGVQGHVKPACMRIGVAVAVGLSEQHDDLAFLERQGAVADAEGRHGGHGVVLPCEEAEQEKVQGRGEGRGEEEAL